MDLGLSGRTALVCGASSGLGLASAEALHEEGVNVVMFARREEELQKQARRLQSQAVVGDLLEHSDIEGAVSTAIKSYGGLDVLVLNGGGPPRGAATEVSEQSIERAVELLLRPMITLINASLPHLRASGRGRIISIGSLAAREPIANLALSAAVRPGLWGYLKLLASEVARDGITVNFVAPGWIATARTRELYGGGDPPESELNSIPVGRLGAPREVGDVVCFLASQQASYVTGALIGVDGGLARSL